MTQLAQVSTAWHRRARRGLAAGHPRAIDGDDHATGPSDGLEVIEYGFYGCGDCADATREFDAVREQLATRVRFAFRHFPITAPDLDTAALAAAATEAAASQGRFWEMHRQLMLSEADLTEAALISEGEAAGLDPDRLASDLISGVHLARVLDDVDSGIAAGVDGTPTFFVAGHRVDGGYDLRELQAVLAAELGQPDLPAELARLRCAHDERMRNARRRRPLGQRLIDRLGGS